MEGREEEREGGAGGGGEESFLAWFFTTPARLLQVPPVVKNVDFCTVRVFSKARESKELLWLGFFGGGGFPLSSELFSFFLAAPGRGKGARGRGTEIEGERTEEAALLQSRGRAL